MAQLKDSIVSGNLRVTDTTLTDTLHVTTIKAPTSAGGTTYGPGTNGQVLKTNGTSVYWGSDSNSVTGVKGNAESTYRTGNVNLTPANIGALALSGGTISSSTFGPLTIERTSTNGSGIFFKNSNGVLGAIGMTNTANGGLLRWTADTSTSYTILDTSNTSFTQTLTSGTKIGTIKINGTSTDIYCQTNTDTDTKVTQAASTTSNFRPIVLGKHNSTNIEELATTETDQVYTTTRFFMQPSTGNVVLYTSNGDDSPALMFRRGSLIDGSLDWKIYNTSGILSFSQTPRDSTSETWVPVVIHKTERTSVSTIKSLVGIYGQTYGNTATELISGTAGVIGYGDGGPQIDFGTSQSGTQRGALIFTDHDRAAVGASFHFVSTESDWNVISKRFHAKSGISIGTTLPTTSSTLYVSGTSNITGNTSIGGTLDVADVTSLASDLVVGTSSQTTYPTGSIRIHDIRTFSVTPANGDKAVNFYFHMSNTPDTAKWWSIMHMRGWGGEYTAWELAGPSHNTDQRTTPLYVRSSNKNTAWGSWRKIYDTSNPPTATEVGAAPAVTGGYLPLSGGTMTGVLNAKGGMYEDSYSSGAINMGNSNITGLNSIYTADLADNAGEGLHFYRDATHVDTLWVANGTILFVPNREIGTSTTAANSQKVARFTENPSSGQIVVSDGTYGGIKSSGYSLSNFLGAVSDGSYYGMATPTGDGTKWIRTTTLGIIPNEAGAAGSGHCGLGTSSWYFSVAYIDTINASTYKTNGTSKGYYLKDSNSSEYPGVIDNGSNLWIGAYSSTSYSHKGQTFISTGWSAASLPTSEGVMTGNSTITISVPKYTVAAGATTGTWSSDNYAVLHAGNYTSYTVTKTGGGASGTWGIDISGNATTATTASKLSNTSKIGSNVNPVYFTANGVPAACGQPASGAWHTGVPSIGGDGVMEIGPYIDMHPKTSTNDYDARLDNTTSNVLQLYFKTTTGSAFVPGVTNVTSLGTSTRKWSEVYATNFVGKLNGFTISGTTDSTYNLDNYLGTVKIGSYYGMANPDGTDTGWTRCSKLGLIPYAANADNTNGNVTDLGSSTWTFRSGFIDYLYYKDLKCVEVTSETIDSITGSFIFKGNDLIGNTWDWVGIAVDSNADKWQTTADNGHLIFRHNDTGGSNTTDWTTWKQFIFPEDVSGSGGITVTRNARTIGSGDDAYTYNTSVTISHSNSITAVTTAAFKKFKYDANGHITGVADVAASDLPSHTHSYAGSSSAGGSANTLHTVYTAGPAELTSYGLLYAPNAGTTNDTTVYKTNTCKIQILDGTTSSTGSANLVLGNNSNSTTNHNSAGMIILYSSNTGNAKLVYAATTANSTFNLPAKTAGTYTLATTGDLDSYVLKAGDTMTGALSFTRTNFIKTFDSSNTEYALIGNNNTNLWIGAMSGDTRAHTGGTYISAGYDTSSSTGNSTIYVSVPKNDNSGSSGSYPVLHTGNTSFTQTLTSGTKIGTIKINGTSTDIYCHTDTDTKVTQGSSTTTDFRALTFGTTRNADPESLETTVTGQLYISKRIFAQPSTGNLYLYSTSGDSPALVFRRGTMTDNYNDWKIYNSGGSLYFDMSTANASSETWNHKLYYNASNNKFYINGTEASVVGHTHSDYVLKAGDTMTGDLTFSGTKGLYYTKSNKTYCLLVDNGSNIWLGSSATAATHHIGRTYISAGYDSTNSVGYSTICVSVPNAANTSATNYDVFHTGNMTITVTGSGNAITTIQRSGTTITATKGTSFLPLTGGTMSGNVTIEKSSGDTGFYAKRTDTDVTVWMGVGAGGVNHGIYTPKLDVWLVHADATTAYIYHKLENPSSEGQYAISFGGSNSTAGSKPRYVNDGLKYVTKEGTASSQGYGVICAGNNIASGTAGNKTGYLRAYGTTAYYAQLNPGALTANRSIQIPDNNGTMALVRAAMIVNSTTTYGWHKFAEVTITTSYQDQTITFLVSRTYNADANYAGILTAHIRLKSDKTVDNAKLTWNLLNDDVNIENVVMTCVETTNTRTYVELWVKIERQYDGWIFAVLKEHIRNDNYNHSYEKWTLRSATETGAASYNTSATKVRVSEPLGLVARTVNPSATGTGTVGTSDLHWSEIYTNKLYGNITSAALNDAIYQLSATSASAEFNGNETLITSIPSSSGTSTPNYQRIKFSQFADAILALSSKVLYDNASNTSTTLTSVPKFDIANNLELTFKSTGNNGTSGQDNSVYTTIQVPYKLNVWLGGNVQVFQPPDASGIMKLSLAPVAVKLTQESSALKVVITKGTPVCVYGSSVSSYSSYSFNLIKIIAKI